MAESSNNSVLEAVNLTKKFDDGVLAVNKLNFVVNSGEVFAMLGGNGAGKTTTINMFLNLLEPTSGEALVMGVDSSKDPLKAKEQLAFVSENIMLYPNFSAVQNIDFFTRLGGKLDYSKDDYRDVLLRVGLPEQVHHKKLKNFSKGMRQKCGIAIAILKDAVAMLLDEPTSGLDPKAGHESMQLLAILRDEGKAILMSTHDIFRAKEASDRIAIMDNGNMVMNEKTSDLMNKDLQDLYMQYMAGHTSAVAS